MRLDIQIDRVSEESPVQTGSTICHVCVECRYAGLFAVQPRVRCMHPTSPFSGKVLFVGQRACKDIVLHDDRAARLSVYGSQIAGFICRGEAAPASLEAAETTGRPRLTPL